MNYLKEEDFEITNEKMLQEIKNKEDKKYLERLKYRNVEMKEQMNKLWQMQSPERVENLPSPPYVIVKDEIEMKDRLQEFRDEFVGNFFIQYDDEDLYYDPHDNKDRELIEDFMVYVH